MEEEEQTIFRGFLDSLGLVGNRACENEVPFKLKPTFALTQTSVSETQVSFKPCSVW